MEGRNIPPLITLTAAMIVSVFCIIKRVSLFDTLMYVLLAMLVFYVIGCIVRKIILKINKDAEAAAAERRLQEQEKADREREQQAAMSETEAEVDEDDNEKK